jgi:ASCH domain
MHALSLKQPWATLLAAGLKTVEVRRWPTVRRGRVLIHAARGPDPRPEAWELVPEELLTAARLCGGIVGEGLLVRCLAYRTSEAFSRDRPRHLNDPSWFARPVLFGFEFTNLSPLPFRPCRGSMKFFPVNYPPSAVNG